MRSFVFSSGVAALLWAAGTSNGAVITTMTADNHYAVYSVGANGTTLTLQIGNELGPDGQPGQYNWSLPETSTPFDTNGFIYVAAWSDDFFAQGLLGDIDLGNGQFLRTGDAAWRVHKTGIDLDDGSAYPTTALMEAEILDANTNNLWMTPVAGQSNVPATVPWGQVPGISSSARWMWAPLASGGNPFDPGTDAGEFLIFCAPIPTPGTLALAGLGVLAGLRRGRRN
jgi:hypothetical protein